ncbi:phage baseplate assembly protein V [Sphingomonas laterariae]|uniref:Phage baseplate assembly protein V n=1 Tax=Edaphosphingomonas laterariae TaxID=861865 RepID=A0A239CJX0_9SPHN|nr:phage baseplate assembly protein V [Sphingomonas laterariae]SNS20536.1 phage baseplate assembly protein V [Sphingomonas laterariae]
MSGNPDIQRLVGDIIRPGVIASVDMVARTCTVEIGDMTTGPLPWLAIRAGRVRIWSPPSEREQCLLLCAEGDTNAGFVLPALYCDAFPPPASSADIVAIAFDDDAMLSYDMAAHHLAATIPDGSVAIDAQGGVAITGDVTITGNVTVSGTLDASEDAIGGGISLKSHKHGGVQAGSAQTGVPA